MRLLLMTVLSLYSLSYVVPCLAQDYNRFILPKNATDSQCRVYLRDHVLELDPIEGFYDVSVTQTGQNAFQTFPSETQSYTDAIVRQNNGTFTFLHSDRATIERLGETNVYNFTYHWSTGDVVTRVYLTDGGLRYTWNHEIPIKEMKSQMGRQYQSGMRVYLKEDAIKTYPTSEDVNRAVSEEKRKQSEQKPQQWSGTGFALKNGYIVTNYHVVEGASSIKIYGVDGSMSNGYVATIVANDKTNDIAIIQIADSHFTCFGSIPYAIDYKMVDVGEDVWVLGYPLTQVLGNEIKLTNGIISSRSGYQGNVSTYQISAPIQPGNSGGPMFDSKGNVVGIVNAGVPGAENVGYAIKMSYLKSLADRNGLSSILPSNNSISTYSLKDQVKKVRNYVFLIMCLTKSNTSPVSYDGINVSSSKAPKEYIPQRSQYGQITGVVKSSQKKALMIGVQVKNMSTKVITWTNSNGAYTIKAKEGDLLEFMSTDYKIVYRTVKDSQVIDVLM